MFCIKVLAVTLILSINSIEAIGGGKFNKSLPITLDFLTSGPCRWIIPLQSLTKQCRHDFELYKKTICEPSLSSLENLWAYKSKHQSEYY